VSSRPIRREIEINRTERRQGRTEEEQGPVEERESTSHDRQRENLGRPPPDPVPAGGGRPLRIPHAPAILVLPPWF